MAVMEEWSMIAGVQALVLWHESQAVGDETWSVDLPVAEFPS